MRAAVLALLIGGCASSEPSVAEPSVAKVAESPPSAPAPDAEPKGDPITVVGVIHEDGTRICDEKGNEQWIDKYFQVGFTQLIIDGSVEAEVKGLHRRPVVVRGHVQNPPPGPTPPSGAECPIYQMRSDWVVTAEGVRIPRGTRAAPGVAVQEVRLFEGLEATHANDKDIRVELTNTLGVPLTEDQKVTAHYEGCFGKPGTHVETKTHKSPLPPGNATSWVFPKFIEDPEGRRGRRLYRLASIQLETKGDNLAFDFDAALHELGLDGITCPRKG